ncbi:hypothetical protein [Streptomyces olivaceoviridis]
MTDGVTAFDDSKGGSGGPSGGSQWKGSAHFPGGSGSFDDNGATWVQPPVPGAGGPGKPTTVDTPSMLLYASNMESLLPHLDNALQRLEPVVAAAGGLPSGRTLRATVGSTQKSTGKASGLVSAYYSSLTDIKAGVTDLVAAVREMAKKYDRLEDLNQMSAAQLQKYMQDAKADFDSLDKHLPTGSTGGSGSGGGGGS